MYADTMTRSMKAAIDETYRRRASSPRYNEEHGIQPRGIVKEIKDLTDRVKAAARRLRPTMPGGSGAGVVAELPKDEVLRIVKDLESQMKIAARDLEFEKAALLRDQIVELRRMMEVDPDRGSGGAPRRSKLIREVRSMLVSRLAGGPDHTRPSARDPVRGAWDHGTGDAYSGWFG